MLKPSLSSFYGYHLLSSIFSNPIYKMTLITLSHQPIKVYYKLTLSKKPHNMSTISNSSSYGLLSTSYYSISMVLNNSNINYYNNSILNSTPIILSNKKNSKSTDSIVKLINLL